MLRNKGLLAILAFTLSVSPAWSKSLYSGFLTESGYLSLSSYYIKVLLFYSPLLIVLDIIFSVVIIYWFKKVIKHGARQ